MEDQTIDLLPIWNAIRKRWLIILVIPVLALLTSGVLNYFVIKPTYKATATMIVGKRADSQADKSLDYNSLLANQKLAKTYETIAKSRTVLDRVAKQIGGNLSSNQVTIGVVKDTEVIAISVEDSNPERAANIANKITTEFTARVIEVKKVDSVSVIDSATVPSSPIKPNKRFNLAFAFVLGLFASVGLIMLVEMLDNTVKSADEVESLLGLPVLGNIPQFKVNANSAK